MTFNWNYGAVVDFPGYTGSNNNIVANRFS